MPDDTYEPKVYMTQGAAQLVVKSGGSIKFEEGGKMLPSSGVQAAHIPNATGATASNCEQTINLMLAALSGVGVTAAE